MDNAFSGEPVDQDYANFMRHAKAFGAGFVDPFGMTSWGLGKLGATDVADTLQRTRGASPWAANAGSLATGFVGGGAALGARGAIGLADKARSALMGAGYGAAGGVPASLNASTYFDGSPHTNMIFPENGDYDPARRGLAGQMEVGRAQRQERHTGQQWQDVNENNMRMRAMSMPLPSRNAFLADEEGVRLD